jgi:hypothetical protein
MMGEGDVVLSQQALEFKLDTDVDALLGEDDDLRAQERDRLRGEIRQKLSVLQNRRAGIVLTFGTSLTPEEGGRLSEETNDLLADTMPSTFEDAVMRDFHIIESNPELRGVVEIEIYVIYQSR